MTAHMTIRTVFAAAALSLIAAPTLAQTGSDTEKNGHHYQGGPKTEVPHHMGKKDTVGSSKETVGSAKDGASGGHHYSGGPATSTPHHMGDKK
jgi:hypothetical protein